jgi:hypothetical protein
MKTSRWLLLAVVALSILSANAQTSSNVSVFATGFSNPRGLKWGPDGNLYVAEGGTGGKAPPVSTCDQVPAPVGPYTGGFNARISKVTPDGTRTTLVDRLPSTSAAIGDVEGVADIAFLGDQMYALMAGAGCSHAHPNFPNSILKVNSDGSWSRIANLSSYIKLHPTKNPEPDDFEPDGTWYTLIAADGVLYAVEPNHGEVDSITPSGVVTRLIDLSETQGHVVPTSIARTASGFVVGNLSTFPIVPGSAARYTISTLGGVTSVLPGLTTVVAVVVSGGDTYFLELNDAPGFPGPNNGKVVRLRAGTFLTVASGLTVPTGMTMGPDGNLYVSNFGAVPAPAGVGQIVKITVPGPL